MNDKKFDKSCVMTPSPDLDLFYMNIALSQAEKSADEGEVPVGAVAVWDDGGEFKVVGIGRNRREKNKNALCHAEIEAINQACNTLGGWRLHRCTLYVTLEPCPMCGGAIINSRIKKVVFGCKDERTGAFGSVFDLNSLPLNHKTEISSGIMEEQCRERMTDFFTSLRKKREEDPSLKKKSSDF